MTKEEFINKHNPSKTIKKSLSASISASVQHNKLYKSPLISNNIKKQVRDFWSSKLILIKEKYVENNWGSDKHNEIIIDLKNEMNKEFENLIDFRISHSQKSISVFFKHLWCLGLINTPPQCPVDRIILTRINLPINERKWGYIDDIEIHKNKIEKIKKTSQKEGYVNISEWELDNFN
jgi:hypothetical protein